MGLISCDLLHIWRRHRSNNVSFFFKCSTNNLNLFCSGGPDLIIYADTIDDEDKSGKSFIGKNLILHSGFTRPSLRNNIALVELSSSLYWFWQLYFYLTSIKPISLGEVPPLSTVVSAGWNTVNDSLLLSTKLNYYYLTTGETSPNGCKSSPEFICTLNQPEDVLCHFDAGAPLILTTNSKERLVGIGSHLINECENQSGATFTRVASYVSWINVITGETFAV